MSFFFDDLELEVGQRQSHGGALDWEEEEEEEEQPLREELQQQPEQRRCSSDAGGSGGSSPGSPVMQQQQQQQCEGCPPSSPRDSEPGEMTCAICLQTIQLEDLALVKGCDHMYCAHCILHWALHKDNPWCPQCKQPFSYLLTYRTLDGTLQDFPSEESVVLLKRARWFEDHVRASEKGKALVEESRVAEEQAWQEYADEYDLAEDEEIEAFYFSSAAGRARVVLENRRFGAGGYLSSGRRHARPMPGGPRRGGGKVAKSGEHAVVGTPPLHRPPPFQTPNANGGRKAVPSSSAAPGPSSVSSGAGGGSSSLLGSSPGSVGASGILGTSPGGPRGVVYGSSPSGSGRRARRNAKRAAMDVAMQQLGFAPPAGPRAAVGALHEATNAH